MSRCPMRGTGSFLKGLHPSHVLKEDTGRGFLEAGARWPETQGRADRWPAVSARTLIVLWRDAPPRDHSCALL